MSGADPKADLHRYLQAGREVLLWKLEGLSEYDVRRPMVPTGTNLLGIVKHVAGVESGYLGETFGRPFGERLPWLDDGAEPNADMWATAEESREQIVGLYRRVWAHSDATIDALPLEAVGQVAWWPPERREVTLHRILVHLVAETDRHAGHADIVRELVDGATGLRPGGVGLAPGDQAWWERYRSRLERVAREAGMGGREMDQRSTKIRELLHEAAETHHRVYRITDGADDDWASWYAQWLVGLSELPELLGGKVVRSELTWLLVRLDKEYAERRPDAPWEDYYADELVRHFSSG